LFATSGAKSGRTGRSTNPFISVQECVVVVKYIVVICVVVETLSFIRVIYIISICGSEVYYANEILYAFLLFQTFLRAKVITNQLLELN